MRWCFCYFFALSLLVPVVSDSATPAHFWSRSFAGNGNEAVMAVAVDPVTGDIVTGGYFDGTLNVGGVSLVAVGVSDAWLARLSGAGQVKWARRFGSASSDGLMGLALDASGNIVITGYANGFIDFGGGSLSGVGNQDFFVVKLDRNGGHVWSRVFGGSGMEQAPDLALDASGNILVCGSFTGTGNFGGPNIGSVGDNDVYFAKYNAAGTWLWNVAAGSTSTDIGQAIAVDASSNVYVTGYFSNTIIFSAPTPLTSVGSVDMFLVKYNSAGVHQWSQRRGGTGDDIPLEMTLDGSANVIVTGGYTGTTNMGGANLVNAGNYDGYYAKYNTSGVHQWSTRFGGAGLDASYDVAADAAGNLITCGAYSTGADLGGGVLASVGSSDVFVARFTSAGAHEWSRGAGGIQEDTPFCIGLDANANAVAGGSIRGLADFGGGNLNVALGDDAFLVKYGLADPDITAITDVGNDQGRSVRIALSRSGMDDGTADLPIDEYHAFRRILPLPANFAPVAKSPGTAPAMAPPGQWEFVAAVPASAAEDYYIIAPTLADSTITEGQYFTKFFVRAATANPAVFFDSAADSGYSVDNLAPGVPQNFVYAAGDLVWDESTAADFDFFTVYGGATNSFAAATVIDYTVSPALDVASSSYNYYFVTATDFSGNEGRPAIVNPASNVGGTPASHVLSVSAYPNPFNPATTVRYTIPSRGHAVLAVYDLSGARVATLVDRAHEAGAFTASWNGRTESGEPAASGVYFARLETSSGMRAYKLTLLK